MNNIAILIFLDNLQQINDILTRTLLNKTNIIFCGNFYFFHHLTISPLQCAACVVAACPSAPLAAWPAPGRHFYERRYPHPWRGWTNPEHKTLSHDTKYLKFVYSKALKIVCLIFSAKKLGFSQFFKLKKQFKFSRFSNLFLTQHCISPLLSYS